MTLLEDLKKKTAFAAGLEVNEVFLRISNKDLCRLIQAYEVLRDALEVCGHRKLVPKDTWPNAEELINDRYFRVSKAQEALVQAQAILEGK